MATNTYSPLEPAVDLRGSDLAFEAVMPDSIVVSDWQYTNATPIPWTSPRAGEIEALWYAANLSNLANYQGMWIGIRGASIVASGATFEDVHDQLTAIGVSDALVVCVPPDVHGQSLLIA